MCIYIYHIPICRKLQNANFKITTIRKVITVLRENEIGTLNTK